MSNQPPMDAMNNAMNDELFFARFQPNPRTAFAEGLLDYLHEQLAAEAASAELDTDPQATVPKQPTARQQPSLAYMIGEPEAPVDEPPARRRQQAAAGDNRTVDTSRRTPERASSMSAQMSLTTAASAGTAVEIVPQPPIPKTYLGRLSVVERILRTRQEFFAEIRGGIRLEQKIVAMMVASATFLGIYGGVMGAASGAAPVLQVMSSAVKLPVLFLITLIICTPSLYFFSLLFGSRQTISQNIALILTAVTTTSVLLVSFAPVALFFLTTGGDYDFVKLLHVVVFAISGIMGVLFLRQGFASSVDAVNPEGRRARRAVFLAWVILYAFVGTQMAWTLRPFIGSPNKGFELIRESNTSNFYENVIDSASNFLQGD